MCDLISNLTLSISSLGLVGAPQTKSGNVWLPKVQKKYNLTFWRDYAGDEARKKTRTIPRIVKSIRKFCRSALWTPWERRTVVMGMKEILRAVLKAIWSIFGFFFCPSSPQKCPFFGFSLTKKIFLTLTKTNPENLILMIIIGFSRF